MRYQSRMLMALLLATVLSLAACQQAPISTDAPTTSPPQPKDKTNPAAVPPGSDRWLQNEVVDWIPVVDHLGHQFRQARLSFEQQDYSKAAADIKQGAAFLKQERENASPEGQAKIDKMVEALNAFAQKVKTGNIASVEELDAIFAQAYQVDIENLWVAVKSDRWVLLIDKPEYYWRQAHDAFVVKDTLDAAEGIRKGLAFLKLRSQHFQGPDQQALSESYQNLDKLADQVERQEIKDVTVLDKAFGKEYLVIAKGDLAQAQTDLSRQDARQMGNALKATAHSVESAAAWGKQEQSVQQIVSQAREVADPMIAGETP
ncbi:MAG: hypothetical protein WA902_14285, partial [Thermosynechococcaceae cyanobacterium]